MATIRKQSAFTIVELLIVIVVIGILAAITIIAYNGIQAKATVASLQSDLENGNKQLSVYFTTSNISNYPTAIDCSSSPAANTICLKSSGTTTYQYSVNNAANPSTYCLTATSGTTSYYVGTATSGPTIGACPGHGVGGVAAITNLAPNPKAATITGWAASAVPGTGSQQPSGGPLSNAQSYYRYTTTGAPTNSPAVIYPVYASGINAIAVPPNTTLQISAYLRSSFSFSAAPSGFRIDIAEYDSTGATVTSSTGTNAIAPINQWQRVNRLYTTSSTTAYIRPVLSFSNNALTTTPAPTGTTFDASAYMVTTGSTLYNYADGDSANWVWNGNTNASSSTGPAL